MKRKEILLGGSGGQGIQLAGEILAEALNNKGYPVAFHKNYGPEARGGRSFAEIVIKESPEDWPEVMKADLLAVLSQESYDVLKKRVKKNGIIIYDPTLVKKIGLRKNIYSLPVSKITLEILNGRINMVLLGIILAFIKLVTLKDVLKILKEKGNFSEENQRSLRVGYNKIEKIALIKKRE